MGVIPTDIYIQVENRLKGRWTAIAQAEKVLEKAKAKATAGRSMQTPSGGSKTRSTRSRVERAAILIVTAEKALDTAWKWEEVFRRLDDIFPPDKTNEGFVASLLYGNGMSQEDVCRFTHCARQTVRRRRDRYIGYAALLAADKGLIDMKGMVNDGDADPESGSAEKN